MSQYIQLLFERAWDSIVPISIAAAFLCGIDYCRFGLSTHFRVWMWRLFYLKCLFVLIFPWSIPQLYPHPFQMPSVRSDLNWISKIQSSELDQLPNAPDQRHWAPLSTTSSHLPSQQPFFTEPIDTPSIDLQSLPSDVRKKIAIEDTSTPSIGDSFPTALRLEWHPLLTTCWMTAVILYAIVLIVGQLRIRRLLLCQSSVPSSEIIALYHRLAQQLAIRNLPKLRLAKNLGSPVLIWSGRSFIVLPSNFQERFGLPAIRMALAHELVHHSRRDLFWNLLATSISCFYFFLPPLWLAARRNRIAMESDCDLETIRMAKLKKRDYANLLVELLEQPNTPFAPAMVAMAKSNSFRSLSERIMAMQNTAPFAVRLFGLTIGCTSLAICLTANWSVAQEDTNRTKKNSKNVSNSGSNSNSRQSNRVALQDQRGKRAASDEKGSSATPLSSNPDSQFIEFGNGSSFQGSNSRSITQSSNSGSAIAAGFASGSFSGSSSGEGTFHGTAQAQSSSGSVPNRLFPSGSPSSSGFGGNSGFQSGNRMQVSSGDQSITVTQRSVNGITYTNVEISTPNDYVVIDHNDSDGVVLKQQDKRQGKKSEKIFTAESLEAFEKKHPKMNRWVEIYLKDVLENGKLELENGMIRAQSGVKGISSIPGFTPSPIAPGAKGFDASQLMRQQLDQLLRDNPGNKQLEQSVSNVLQQLPN